MRWLLRTWFSSQVSSRSTSRRSSPSWSPGSLGRTAWRSFGGRLTFVTRGAREVPSSGHVLRCTDERAVECLPGTVPMNVGPRRGVSIPRGENVGGRGRAGADTKIWGRGEVRTRRKEGSRFPLEAKTEARGEGEVGRMDPSMGTWRRESTDATYTTFGVARADDRTTISRSRIRPRCFHAHVHPSSSIETRDTVPSRPIPPSGTTGRFPMGEEPGRPSLSIANRTRTPSGSPRVIVRDPSRRTHVDATAVGTRARRNGC